MIVRCEDGYVYRVFGLFPLNNREIQLVKQKVKMKPSQKLLRLEITA